ncbi:MAG: ruvC [Chlamydiia bacterium]|nr:ruvC [Chlamydiia bacterium]
MTSSSNTLDSESEHIIIGIDPGTRVTGYGVIALSGRKMKTLDYGCIRPPPDALLSDRYLVIFESLEELINTHKPTVMAIETPFVSKNIQSALKLGTAQGVAIMGAKRKQIKVFGYSPRAVKCSIVGTGKASKEQLQGAVARYLNLSELPRPYDAADALAIALCHIQGMQNSLSRYLKNEI